MEDIILYATSNFQITVTSIWNIINLEIRQAVK